MILQAFIRGAIVIALAALFATLLRNRSAALRHHVWATAVVVQLALLAFIPVLPKITLPIVPVIQAEIAAPPTPDIDAEEAAAQQSVERSSSSTSPSTSPRTSPQTAGPNPGPQPAPENARTLNDYLLLIWLAGAAIIFARYLIGTLLMLRIAIRGERVEDGDWLVLAQRTARELGITRPVTMIWGDKVSVPITWGVLYPMILLPTSAREWPQERRRFVLVHEMAHVKRFDAFTQFLAQVTSAVFWFSPFVWLAEWRMRIEREHACDDTVIQHGTEPAMYADELLQMVRSLVRRRAQQPAFAALAMARKSEFEGRMLAILDPERPRRVTGVTSGLVFALLSILIAAPLAAIDPFAVRVVTTSLPTMEVAPPVAQQLAAKASAAAAWTSSADCDFNSKSIGTQAEIHGDPVGVEVRLKRTGRCVYADIAGPVRISPDERRVLAVEPGGRVRVRETTPGRDVELKIEHTTGAGVKRFFTINGRAPDDDGRTERDWLARVLPEALSEGAIRSQERVRHMLQSNGLNATLRQIAAFTSSSARVAHFKELVAIGNWTSAELSRIRSAAETSLGPRDLQAFNRVLPKNEVNSDTPKVMTSDVELMEQILKGISSSYDLRMAMKSQLTKADRPMLLMYMRVAPKMSSSYELASFLIEAKPYYLTDNDVALEDSWFNVAAKVSSPNERARVLTGILDYAAGSERAAFKLLRATTNMSSGADKASLLAAVAKKKLITTPALRSEFLAQVNTIVSGVDRRMVLEALQ